MHLYEAVGAFSFLFEHFLDMPPYPELSDSPLVCHCDEMIWMGMNEEKEKEKEIKRKGKEKGRM